MTRDSRSASIEAPGSVSRRGSVGHGARTSSPTSGSTRNEHGHRARRHQDGGSPVVRRDGARADAATVLTAAGSPRSASTLLPAADRT